MTILDEEYSNLEQEIILGSTADGTPKVEEFFRIFSELAADNGDCPDLTYCPAFITGGLRADGYAFDISEKTEEASGDLYIAICAYFQNEKLPTVNAGDIEKITAEARRFLQLAASNKSLDNLEESSHAYKLALLIRMHLNKLGRVRLVVLTNAKLVIRKKLFETFQVCGLPVHTDVLDIARYVKIAATGSDPIEINFVENFSGGIPCIEVSGNEAGYKSYLFAIPGSTLADIFAAYGNRLLEQNVRTYLQDKTNVNKGILRTIEKEPSMFFAYNNGITATASAVVTTNSANGSQLITYIKDFQIVNGGQTTASILFARDGKNKNYDLSKVFAQVKLSVVEESLLGEVVPKISEYANTQNKVLATDFVSNNPIHIKIERLSKSVAVPRKAGELHSTKWFYERVRGSYRSLMSYKYGSDKKKVELEYPKSQLIEKTDLAKFEFSFDCRPDYVSLGAQKCFSLYMDKYVKIKNELDYDEDWFRRAASKGLLFRRLDKEIAKSDWYKSKKGLKAQTVTYSIAACSQSFRDIGYEIDLLKLWKEQDVPPRLLDWILNQASIVHKILINPPDTDTDAAEFCKKDYCWFKFVKGKVNEPPSTMLEYGIPYAPNAEEVQSVGNVDGSLDFDEKLAALVPRAHDIRSMAEVKNLISPKNNIALKKLESGQLSFTKQDKNALKTLLMRLEIKI
jgi:hypothetical protein